MGMTPQANKMTDRLRSMRSLRIAETAGLPVILGWIVLGLIIPPLFNDTYLFTWTTAIIWALFALGTNVLFGWSGLLSFGQTGFFGLGGYTIGLVHEHHPGIDGVVLLIIAGVVAAAVGAVFSLMALRSSGAEFAVLTLVAAQVLLLLTSRVRALRGDDGFGGLDSIKILGTQLNSDTQTWHYFVVIVAICSWLLWMLHRSSLGASMRAIRDDAHRAAALGIRVRRVQIKSFAVGSAFSAVAGGLLGMQQGVVSPSILSLTISGEVLVACLVGGLRVFGGPVLGAFVLILAQQVLSGVTTDSTVFVGIFLLVVVLALPSGLTSLPHVLRQQFSRWQRTPPSSEPPPSTALADGVGEPPLAVSEPVSSAAAEVRP
jgi:branched-chain amino acid transport system permease protein